MVEFIRFIKVVGDFLKYCLDMILNVILDENVYIYFILVNRKERLC